MKIERKTISWFFEAQRMQHKKCNTEFICGYYQTTIISYFVLWLADHVLQNPAARKVSNTAKSERDTSQRDLALQLLIFLLKMLKCNVKINKVPIP